MSDLFDRAEWPRIPQSPYGFFPLDGVTPRRHGGVRSRTLPRSAPPTTVATSFDVTDIPHVMDRLRWTQGARLMRLWFRRPAWTMPTPVKLNRVHPGTLSADQLDEGGVTMEWMLRFPRVRTAYDELVQKFANPAARLVLAERLQPWVRASRLKVGDTARFGDLGQPAKLIDWTCQTNMLRAGTKNDPLDDYFGAIGIGTLKVAVSAMVQLTGPESYRVSIDEIGVYLRDTYDFNTDPSAWIEEPLGYWDARGVSKFDPINRTRITNKSFRDWRDASGPRGRGGDFVVYSDVRRTRLSTPTRFAL